MKGTDVTTEDLAAAQDFLDKARTLPSNEPFKMTRDGLIRLLAWYGAIRAKRGKPGPRVVEKDGAGE